MPATREPIYLDHAATSFPKPEAVYAAMDRFHREVGVAAGRGGHPAAVEAARVVQSCRARLATLLHVADASRIVFTLNATDALHLALKGLLRKGDRVVTTAMEHNSVLRPLAALAERDGVKVEKARADATGVVDLEDVARLLRDDAKLLAIQHASNVSGAVQPVAEAARLAWAAGALVLVDAAQTMGGRNVDPAALGADLVAFAGHKGLLGPLGTGALWVAPGVDLASVREGGTGTRSEEDRQPDSWPDRHESGSANTPGIAGLDAALGVILDAGVDSIRAHKEALSARFLERSASIAGLEVFGPRDPAAREPVFCVRLPGLGSHDVATLLDVEFGIRVRAGLHCAPLAHRAIGTFPDGAARLSFGWTTTESDVDRALDALRALAAGSPK